MAADWKAPEDWQKDGSIISGVTSLKTGAWTSMLSAKEVRNGREVDVVIKTFSVPEHVLEDPDRIAREREKFLTSARLQKKLTDDNAAAWVPILRISEDPHNTSFSMVKSGASLQDILDRRVNLTAKDLYEVTLSVLQGFEEIQTKAKRSHGSLKASDVLSVPGHHPPYQIADPSPKGDTHAANDLYALGQILFQLIEHREWDPLSPIVPTGNWARFKGRRDRWMHFLNMLLAPNGCQEPLSNVRREAQRLKPGSPMKMLMIAASLFMCVGLAGVGVLVLAWPTIKSKLEGMRGGGAGGGGGGVATGPATPAIDPQVKAGWEKSHDAYLAARNKWQSRQQTSTYDHAKSTAVIRDIIEINNRVTDLQLTDAAAYQKSKEMYDTATAKYTEALGLYADETQAGEALDARALADFQAAQDDYNKAKAAWEDAAGKFDARHDHTQSKAIVQATPTPPTTAPASAAGRQTAAEQLRSAAARYAQAVAMARDEENAGKGMELAQADLKTAREKYQAAKDRWDSGVAGVDFDIAAAKAAADKARAGVPDQLVLTDVNSYQSATDAFKHGAEQYDAAYALLDQAKRDHATQATAAAAAALADFQAAQDGFNKAKAAWQDAAGKFGAGEDHGPSKAIVQAIAQPPATAPADVAGRRAAAEQLKAATAKYAQALSMAKDETLASNSADRAKSDFLAARDKYQGAWDRWNAAIVGVDFDISASKAAAGAAKASTPVQQTFTDVKSYQAATAAFNDATAKMEAAYALLDQAKRDHAAVASDAGAALAKAKDAMDKRDFEGALAYYRSAADLGSAAGMYGVGYLYETGQGTDKNPAEAAKWYQKAADLNITPAMVNLGLLYERGQGVAKNTDQARALYRKAADLNDVNGMRNLAYLYDNGIGVPRDASEALRWYQKGADLNDPSSMFNVGVAYEQAKGVGQDYEKAVAWYTKASNLKYPRAMNALGVIYETGRGVKQDLGLAMSWYKKAAELGYAPAMSNVGALYDNGAGVALDHTEAFKWFTQGAEKGDGMCMYNLGVEYETGRGTAANLSEALKWYRAAAHSDDTQAIKQATDRLGALGFRP